MKILILFVLLLVGCAPDIRSGAPLLTSVALPDALVKSNPAVTAVGETALPEKWWREFHDPGLDHLVDLALAGNPGLKEANARLRKAQAAVVEVQSRLLPHVGSLGQIIRGRKSPHGSLSIYNGKTSTLTSTFRLFSISYHLDFWKQDEERISASLASQQTTAAQYRQSALMLSSAVIKTYFALNISKNIETVQAEIVHLSESAARLRNIAYHAGIQPENPSLAQSARLLEAKAILASLRKRTEILHFALMDLLGKGPDDKIPDLSVKGSIPERFVIPRRIDLALVSQRPDIQAALWNVRRQSHLEKVAQKAFYPNIDLLALAGLSSAGLSDLLRAKSGIYAYGPAVQLPLFEGGALTGRLHESEAAHDVAVHAYNQNMITAIRQIAAALATLKYTRIQLDEKTASLKLRISQARVAESGFRSGITGKLPYLEASIRARRAKMVHLEERLNWLNSITDAATSLGGGFGKWPT